MQPYKSNSKSSVKQLNQWLWTQFRVTPLSGKLWRPKRNRQILEDREIQCIQCGWKIADSARATSTSNRISHLAKHNIFEDPREEGLDEWTGVVRQQSIASIFQSRAENDVRELLEQNILRWIVIDDVADASRLAVWHTEIALGNAECIVVEQNVL